MGKAEAIMERLIGVGGKEKLALSRLREDGFRWKDLAPALRAAGSLVEEEDLPLLVALGALAGTFQHREGVHPVLALKGLGPGFGARLEAILEAQDGLEMAWRLLRFRGPLEGLDLLEAARGVGDWPRQRTAWAKLAWE